MQKHTIIDELRKELALYKMSNIKPNFAALGRKYGLDWRIVKKYYLGYEGKPKNKHKASKLDQHYDVIKEKLAYPGVKMSAVYFFLTDTENYKGKYNTFTAYVRKHPELYNIKKDNSSHARYETPKGEQCQFDWVEDITLVNKYGVAFNFNVFSAELGYSRLHYFRYSKTKTREDVFMSLIDTFKYFGGVPKSCLTDNMSSIVNTNEKVFVDEFIAFAKDVGFNSNKCKVKHPFTKGKVEVRNKFIKWLIPYNSYFENEEDIIRIINKINYTVNNQINDTTNMKPILLFEKEKEHLNPLPSNDILEHYLNLSTPVKVDNTSLIYYKGNKYSVPQKFINKTLKLKEIDNKLYIYDNTDLVTVHDISDKKLNYQKDTYIEILKSRITDKSDDQIEALAERNLELINEIANMSKV